MQKNTLLIMILLWTAVLSAGAAGHFTLVIDAGHGGKDPGAKGAHAYEKDVALNVAKAFGRYVEKNCSDVKVVYTRKTDVFIPLEERANIANRNKADLFVSIHCNALPGGKISRGVETYTLGMHRAADNLEVAKRENSVILIEDNYKTTYAGFDPRSSESYIIFELMQDQNMKQSVNMANLVQKKLCGSMNRPNKGVKQAGFLVLRATSMASCLIELGFITTPDEERLMTSPTGVESMAYSIYQAFVEYKNKVRGTSTRPASKTVVADDSQSQSQPAKKEPVSATPVSPSSGSHDTAQDKPYPVAGTTDGGDKSTATGTDAKASPTLFKVQILTSDVKLKPGSSKLKGQTDTDFYKEGALYKYTVGSSADYNEILRLLKSLKTKFPDAFMIAFKDGKKTNLSEAITEFKEKNKKSARK